MRRGRPAGDDGVVAIVVALSVASFLLVVGAFAVDFGNAFARRQNLQTSVDLAALAGAAMLPDQAAAIEKIHESLCHGGNENKVNGWDSSVCAGNGWMTDPDPDNGQVTFFGPDADGNGRYEPGEAAGAGVEATALRIVTPKAHVEFGLGQITGASGVDLSRAATAKVGSLTGPGGVQPIPVTPPETGTICLSDEPSDDDGPTPPAGSEAGLLRLLLTITGNLTPGQRVGLSVENYLNLAGIASVHVIAYSGTNRDDLGVPIQHDTEGDYFLAPTLNLPPTFVAVYVQIGLLRTIYVPVTYAGMDACGAARIDRGYIAETRFTGLSLALNLQLGIDHAVRPWSEFPSGNLPPLGLRECNDQLGRGVAVSSTGGAPEPVVNCLTVRDDLQLVSLSHIPYLHLGGLLARESCPGGSRGYLNGHPNLDVTSMFSAGFTPGGAGGQIAAAIRAGLPPTPEQEGSLSPKLFLCPRLVAVPVLDAPIVNGAISTGSYPVQGLAYLYLEPDGGSYGFTFSDRTVIRINAIVIDPRWFPKTASLPLPVGEYLGENLTKQVALVHDSDDPDT